MTIARKLDESRRGRAATAGTAARGSLLATLMAAICLLPIAASTTAHAQSRLPWADANPLERLFGKPGEKRRPERRSQSKAKAAPAVPAIAAVPVPDARPSEGDRDAGDAAASATGAAVGGKVPDGSPPGVTTGAPAPMDAAADDEAAARKIGTEAGTDAEPNTPPAASGSVASDDAVSASKSASDAAAESPGNSADPLASPSPMPASGDPAPAEAGKASAAPSGGEQPAMEDGVPAVGEAAVSSAPDAAAQKPVSEIPVPETRPPEAPGSDEAPAASTTKPLPTPAAAEAAKPDEAPNSTEKLKGRIPDISPATAVLAAAAIADAELCEAELKARGVEFSVGESISEGECGVLRPVDVTKLASGVSVSPDTQFLCRTALALDDWMTASVVPEAKADFGKDRLTEFRHASTYVCRPRASEKGISEHARGSAIDIASFVFESGKTIGVEAQAAGSPEAAFQAKVRAGACGPFRTVLGPGTDADHATHFHLDIAARKNGSTYCR